MYVRNITRGRKNVFVAPTDHKYERTDLIATGNLKNSTNAILTCAKLVLYMSYKFVCVIKRLRYVVLRNKSLHSLFRNRKSRFQIRIKTIYNTHSHTGNVVGVLSTNHIVIIASLSISKDKICRGINVFLFLLKDNAVEILSNIRVTFKKTAKQH